MSWFKQKEPSEISPKSSQDQYSVKSTETRLVEELSNYAREYQERIKDEANRDAVEANDTVRKARDFVSSSHLGYALTRPLLNHLRYWPSWSARDDFAKYAAAPFGYISGSVSRDNRPTTIVTFTYNSTQYTLKFVDEGTNQWVSDDLNEYGTVELVHNQITVLGLNIKKDLSREYDDWAMYNVFALQPGLWMKDLVEMAAYIEAERQKRINSAAEKDALDRASRIKLPD